MQDTDTKQFEANPLSEVVVNIEMAKWKVAFRLNLNKVKSWLILSVLPNSVCVCVLPG